jgi:hypothetical protein
MLSAVRVQIAQTDARLQASQQQVAAYVDSLAQSQYQLAATRARALAHGENARQETDRLREQVREAMRQRDEEIDRRERKIRSMQNSFSWQVTSPLRALRRVLIDPFRSTPVKSQAASVPEASPA